LNFTVKATDADAGDSVSLTGAGIPAGATMTPGLPASGNPVQSAFSWPSPTAGTQVLTFAATDKAGHQPLCTITLVVKGGPPTDTTKPTCTLTSKTATGITVTTRDTGSGLKSIVVTTHTNATVNVPSFSPGVKTPVVVTATKSDVTKA